MSTPRLLFVPLLLSLACGGSDPGGSTGGTDDSTSTGPGTSTGTTDTPGPTGTGVDPTTPTSSTTSATTTTTTTTGDETTTTTSPVTSTTTTTGGPDTTTTTTTGDTDTTTGGPIDGFLIGVHTADVSPSDAHLDQNVYMGAYGAPFTRGPAQGVHDAIFARSFAIEGEGGGVIMAIVDLPGMGNQNTRAVRQKVAELTGLDEGQVLVGTTHSHSAPDLMGLWGGVPDDYRDFINDEIAHSMAAAWDARVPATLAVATVKAPNNNRRGWGFTDDDMTILDAKDLEGNRLGTLVNFAAHPVILGEDNKEISCDYVGYSVQKIEAALGAPASLFNGTLGDATPKVPDGQYPDDFARAQAYGELLADIAIAAVETAEPVEGTLVWSHTEWEQGVDNLLFQLAAGLGILQFDFESMGLSQVVTTQSTYFRLGTQVQGVAFPGESLTRNGLAIKEVMKTPHKMILGNTGDALGYFIPSDEWQTGKNDNYEETVSLGKTAGDTARDKINALVTADNANF
ncbi:hypothetical protein SAMN02745121_01603 [Nannocystis exedens]|uniref:Uncharacterized protein n=1 Tax=Nannocystis exedens TaxID=54 RepID=A0A1I1V7T9_9BACT|nr:neutral/alkaline non-lysosomal ceramidase N-terminal domain-containing protein [Nannocystis exedens]PCC72426.1 Neutral/alkaline non-lysosomal ceramidase [Nannocystis exedens]SFD78915.1 hypothetical protein SAMN02745121_01603 [Nannocystis exedens]